MTDGIKPIVDINPQDRPAQYNEFGEPILFPPEYSRRFARYRVGIRFLDKLVGGIPNDPKAIEGWIATRMMITDADAQFDMVVKTLQETGIDVPDNATREEVMEAVAQVADTTHACGFKSDKRGGAYLESRCLKAFLKEVINILYAGGRWGPTKKGPKSWAAERAFIWPDRLYLGNRPQGMLDMADDEVTAKFQKAERNGSDGRLLFTGHTTGPKGPVSTLTYYQFVHRTRMEFDVMVADDGIDMDTWREILEHGQQNGLGTLRSQGHGRFQVVRFERVPDGEPMLDGSESMDGERRALAEMAAVEQRLKNEELFKASQRVERKAAKVGNGQVVEPVEV